MKIIILVKKSHIECIVESSQLSHRLIAMAVYS